MSQMQKVPEAAQSGQGIISSAWGLETEGNEGLVRGVSGEREAGAGSGRAPSTGRSVEVKLPTVRGVAGA